ncbi:MAG: molybdenum cofactor carrier [Pseudorhodoplanes sp.]|nr:molybdenum cofactor carrier [Pseudorhodoplanes sp.]
MEPTARLVIISGGQSGADRAALDVARELGLAYEGWCPQGGWAEDCSEPPGLLARYPLLRETPQREPAQRTDWNVRDSDATLILLDAAGIDVSQGTMLARECAARYGKPLHVAGLAAADDLAQAKAWLADLMDRHPAGLPFRLGIGGPRESEAPGIYAKAGAFLRALLSFAPAQARS